MIGKRRTSGVVLAGGLLAAALLTAQPAGANQALGSSSPSPSGCWEAQASEGDMPPADVEIQFREDSTLKLIGPPDENGDPFFVGTGEWATTSSGSFEFTVNHPLPAGPPGEARSALDGELSSSDEFAAEGETYSHYDDGTVEGPSTIKISGTRTTC